MTTPNTLKAALTADVGDAQVAIQRLIKTVEDMGRTVNATSQAGQKAFKAEADEVARLVVQMGASEKQITRLSAARTSFAARVKSESQQAATAAAQMSTAYGGAAKDVVKGLASIATESKVTAGGLKDILSGVGSLAFAFGPAGAFVSAVAIGASAIVGLFTSAREEMEKTQQAFTDRITDMRRSANAEGLRNEAKRIFDEMAPLQARLAQAQRNDFGGLTVGEGLNARRTLPARIAALQAQFDAAREAALNPVEDIARSGLNRVTVTADGPGSRSGSTTRARESTVGADVDAMGNISSNARGLGSLRDFMTAVPTGENSPLAMIAADAAKPISAFERLRVEITSTAMDLKNMGAVGTEALTAGISAGLDALILGQGNAIAALKRAAAEPIVAKLKMNAIESIGQAAKYAASLNFPAAGIALASAAKNTAGAYAVARLGGMSAGNGTEGVNAGGTGGGGRNAALPGDGLSSARNDRPIRIEMVLVTRTPDGRELSRTRQQIQRLDDRNQPIRVVL
jgi:hypothetical protein